MSHTKVYFVILGFAFLIASTSLASDRKAAQFRYLAPLSTNLKQDNDIQDSEDPEPIIHDNFMTKKEIPDKDLKENLEFVIEFSKSAADKVRESELKAKEIEREVMKRKLEGERAFKKMMDQIDREQRKYIVEIQRQEKKHRSEMEKAYRKRLKEMEED
jgi:hypothetical protein